MTEVEFIEISKEINQLAEQVMILDGNNSIENKSLNVCCERLSYLVAVLRSEINKPKASYLRILN